MTVWLLCLSGCDKRATMRFYAQKPVAQRARRPYLTWAVMPQVLRFILYVYLLFTWNTATIFWHETRSLRNRAESAHPVPCGVCRPQELWLIATSNAIFFLYSFGFFYKERSIAQTLQVCF